MFPLTINITGNLEPFTDEEHNQMLNEAENSPILIAEEAEEYSKELIEKWGHKD